MWKGKIKLRVCLLNWMVLLNADFLVYTWGLPLTWPEASYCSSFLVVSATASLWAGSQFFSFLSLINLSCNFFGNNSKMGFTPTWYKPLGLFQVSGIYKKKHQSHNSHQHRSWMIMKWLPKNYILQVLYTGFSVSSTLYMLTMSESLYSVYIYWCHQYSKKYIPWVYDL